MLPKLHLITWKDDGLRPAMSVVQITKKDLRATDGLCLAIIPTAKTCLNVEELPEEAIYLHQESYKLLTVSSIIAIKYDAVKAQFEAYHKGNKPVTVVPISKMDERFPEFESIIPHRDTAVELSLIGLNPKILAKLAEAVEIPGNPLTGVGLEFHGHNRIIEVFLLSDGDYYDGVRAFVMPVMIKAERINRNA
jgi:hypothetical protein